MKIPHRCTALLVALTFHGAASIACGPWFPRRYLEKGGAELLQSPEFFAEYELKLLARDYPVPFKAVNDEFPMKATGERDVSDYDAAIKDGSIRPRDVEAARAAHRRMRNVLREISALEPDDAAAVPDDMFEDAKKASFPSEFADYHEGAIEYGRTRHAAARAVWERLLARPRAERRYRSVNAAFMIGMLAVVDDLDDAPKWLAMARELARKGFRDSCGLAAATYSWESQWHDSRGDLREAAENALRSISAGYPTRHCLEPKDNSPKELAKFAADPLLRRITTSLLLANHTSGFSDPDPNKNAYGLWLNAIEAADVRNFAGAEQVGWMCYDKADYSGAKRWLARAPAQSPESLRLAGKLAARDGKRDEALMFLAKAARLTAQDREAKLAVTELNPDKYLPPVQIAGEHGLAAINAAKFSEALSAFTEGGHDADASYVAERLLTLRELQSFVHRQKWDESWWLKGNPETDDTPRDAAQQAAGLRWLLARRLARAGHFTEARSYFPPAYRPALDAYTKGIATGENRKLPDDARAMGFWRAALEARYNGIELFGTETGPDWFLRGGEFDEGDIALQRTSGTPFRTRDDGIIQPLPAMLRALDVERRRLTTSELMCNKRFHYRYQAADIAWRAAQLLPDNDPRLAEMLDLAGRWNAPRDPEAADRFYQALESRCAETDIGQRATKQRWFVDIATYTIPREAVAVPKKSE